jgi:hypothetical protein
MLLPCREMQCEVLGFGVPWGDMASVANCRVAGYTFPSINKKSGILSLGWRSKNSLAIRDLSVLWGVNTVLPAE